MVNFTRIFTVFLLLLSFSIHASDLAKEKRWANQVVDAILDGEAVWLNNGKHDFLGIYTEAEDTKRAVIIMHGTGVHPDWQQVVQPLRVGLIAENWNTLAIQMPVLPNEADYTEYAPLYNDVAPRIDAAIKFLKENEINEIVLIGHSQGAAMTAYYLRSTAHKIKGFVAIGMSVFDVDPRMNSLISLEKIQIPVLDLYGTEDLEGVLKTIDARAAAAKRAGNKNYTQKKISGSHFFDGNEDELVKAVADWLK